MKINEIKEKELPELDDELAKDVSEFDTLEEYKEDIKKGLLEEKEKNAKRIKEDKVVDLIIDNTEIDIPEAMIKTQARQILDEFGQRMQYQGISIEQYYQFTGTNEAQLLEQMNPQAVKRIQTRLVQEEIVKVEDIKVSEEEFATEFEKLAETYQMELDKINEMIGESEKEQMRLDISVQKAIDLVVEASVEVEVVEEVEITEEQETKEEDK